MIASHKINSTTQPPNTVNYKCLNKMVVYTKRFCLHKIGSFVIICIDSNTFKWNSDLPCEITLNIFLLYLAPQSGFFNKCSAIADAVDVVAFSSSGAPKHFSIFLGTCWAILLSSLCDVIPTYELSQLHSKWYMSWLLLWEGMASLDDEGRIALDVNTTLGLTVL